MLFLLVTYADVFAAFARLGNPSPFIGQPAREMASCVITSAGNSVTVTLSSPAISLSRLVLTCLSYDSRFRKVGYHKRVLATYAFFEELASFILRYS